MFTECQSAPSELGIPYIFLYRQVAGMSYLLLVLFGFHLLAPMQSELASGYLERANLGVCFSGEPPRPPS